MTNEEARDNLVAGDTIKIRRSGNSMTPRIKSGQLLTIDISRSGTMGDIYDLELDSKILGEGKCPKCFTKLPCTGHGYGGSSTETKVTKTKAKKPHGWKGKIPFCADRPPTEWDIKQGRTDVYLGGQLSYANEWDYKDREHEGEDVSIPNQWHVYWLDNHVFEDTLEFESCSRGRSAATFTFKRLNGRTVEFFMSEVVRLFPYFRDGKVTGQFTFVKRGANYSCSILESKPSS